MKDDDGDRGDDEARKRKKDKEQRTRTKNSFRIGCGPWTVDKAVDRGLWTVDRARGPSPRP